jgi:hypothetical protein
VLAVNDALPNGTSRRTGHVMGRWGTEKALVAMPQGVLYELPVPRHLADELTIAGEVVVYVGPHAEPLGWMLGEPRRGALLQEHVAELGEEFVSAFAREPCDGAVVACSADRRQARIALHGLALKVWVDVPHLLRPHLREGARVIALLEGDRVADWTIVG